MTDTTEIKCLSKFELAQKLNISVRWLSYYLNSVWFEELSTKVKYSKRQRILLPYQLNFIYDKFVYIDEKEA